MGAQLWGRAKDLQCIDLEVSFHEGQLSEAHAATNRVLCYWQNGKRQAYVFKSPFLPAAGAEFTVSSDGIRGHAPRNQGVKRK